MQNLKLILIDKGYNESAASTLSTQKILISTGALFWLNMSENLLAEPVSGRHKKQFLSVKKYYSFHTTTPGEVNTLLPIKIFPCVGIATLKTASE